MITIVNILESLKFSVMWISEILYPYSLYTPLIKKIEFLYLNQIFLLRYRFFLLFKILELIFPLFFILFLTPIVVMNNLNKYLFSLSPLLRSNIKLRCIGRMEETFKKKRSAILTTIKKKKLYPVRF